MTADITMHKASEVLVADKDQNLKKNKERCLKLYQRNKTKAKYLMYKASKPESFV